MLIRALVTCSFLAAPVIAQEQTSQRAPEKQPDPRIQRFLNRPNFFAQKKPNPVAKRVEQAPSAKVCSIPLTNVTPPAIPYMPTIRPPRNTHIMTIAPPAPPCDEKRVEAP